ncbi:MAG: hypothetical protein KJP03_02220 [Gammaproteobacteria bacterium]|nr:hypothetical protein [Gammaproteobacteria bacterium]
MMRIIVLTLTLVSALSVAACGLKGDLYIEEATEAAAEEATAPENNADNDAGERNEMMTDEIPVADEGTE